MLQHKRFHLLFSFFFMLLAYVELVAAERGKTGEAAKELERIYWEYPWFKQSFLDLREDIEEAASEDKGLILYFHQEGCPYCKKLLNDNFKRPELVKKLRSAYDFIAINMWGDREVTALDGTALTEKSLAVKMKVMFTPTLVFLDKNGKVSFRLNGYYAPEKFDLLLDYLALKKQQKINISFTKFYKQQSGKVAEDTPAATQVVDLQKKYAHSDKPVMLVFSETPCAECDELEQMLNKEPVKSASQQFHIIRASIYSKQPVIDLNGRKTDYAQWAEQLQIKHTPSEIFLVKQGQTWKEIFRNESYLRTFHFESVLLYVAEGHYKKYPEFQRYIHDRVDQLRKQGKTIDLWK